MIREELFVQRGLELDFPGTDPDTRTALVAAVEQQVVADVTTHQPADAELQKYFEENRSSYATEGTMALHNLLLPKAKASGPDALAAAQKVAEALRAHMPLAEVVKTYGLQELVPEHASDEQFYFAQKIHLGEALYERVLSLGDGEVSDPVAAADGIHVIQMVKHTKPLPLTFERVRSQVLNDFITAAKKRLEDADLQYLREKGDILIADDYAADYEKSQAEKTEAAKPAGSGKP
jgi:parvulin-like peptidyl-prolyl isomerase